MMFEQNILDEMFEESEDKARVERMAVQAPPTHKDVLLKKWKNDTEALAKRMIEQHTIGMQAMFPVYVSRAAKASAQEDTADEG
jgi:hypothetical protein